MAMFDENQRLRQLLSDLRTWEDIVARGVETLAPSRRIAAYVAAVVSCTGLGLVALPLGVQGQRTALEHERAGLERDIRELRQEQYQGEAIEQQKAELAANLADLHAALFAQTTRFDVVSAVTLIDDLARTNGIVVDRIAVRESPGIGLSIEARGGFVALATWVRRLAESELLITYEALRLSRPELSTPENRGLLMLSATVTVHLPGEEA